MKNLLLRAGAVALVLMPSFALGQGAPIVNAPANNGQTVPLQAQAFGGLGQVATPVDATHGLPVNCISGCNGNPGGPTGDPSSTGTAGSAPPANGSVTLFWDGSVLRRPLTDSSGRQIVVVYSMPTTAVTGTFWQATQPVSAAALPLPSGAATETTLAAQSAKLPASVGAKPGATSLSVVPNSDTPFPVVGLSNDAAPATLTVSAADASTTNTPGANAQPLYTGTPTANSTASFTLSSVDAVRVQVTGTWVGTLQLEQSIDGGTTWYSIGLHQSGTTFTSNGFTSNFIGGQNASGATNVRARATAWTSGTATVKIVASQNPNSFYLANAVNINQTTPGSTNGVVPNDAAFYNGATGAASLLASSATFTGAARDAGVAAGTAHPYAYFNAFFLTDQAGTARIDCSNDNTTWYACSDPAQVLTAGKPLTLTVPVMTRYHRAVVVNGATAETYLWVNTSYTGA